MGIFGEGGLFGHKAPEDPNPMEEGEEGLIIQPEENDTVERDPNQMSEGDPIIDRDPPLDDETGIGQDKEQEEGA